MEGESWLRRFWNFIKKDTWQSLVVSLILAFIIIKFIFFPLLSFVTGTALPLVIVESCSMYHSTTMEGVMKNPIYAEYNISLEESKSWPFQYGINKGDIIFVVSGKNFKVGDVIIFNAGTQNPIIHRVIDSQNLTTKGDHNSALLSVEQNVNRNQVVGKAVFRIPLAGWIKLIFFDWQKSSGERGLCS